MMSDLSKQKNSNDTNKQKEYQETYEETYRFIERFEKSSCDSILNYFEEAEYEDRLQVKIHIKRAERKYRK